VHITYFLLLSWRSEETKNLIPNDKQNSDLSKYKWLKWGHRIFLILTVIMPSVYTLIYFLYIEKIDPAPRSELEVLQWTIFIVPFAILAWFKPILGGILIIIGTHLVLLYYWFQSFWGGYGIAGHFLLPQYLILITAGILSVGWGAVRLPDQKNGSD
jgi:hypothetical protein